MQKNTGKEKNTAAKEKEKKIQLKIFPTSKKLVIWEACKNYCSSALKCIYKPLAFSFVWFISVKHLNKVNITISQISKGRHDRNTKSWILPDKFKFFF